MKFLLKAGCSDELYRQDFVNSPFYSEEYPLTFKTAKNRLLTIAAEIVQVNTCITLL
jgi:hypothetical protein